MKGFIRPAGITTTFVKGYRYRVRRELPFGASQDDILIFVDGGQFSAYDESWIYTFRRERDNVEISWLLHDDDAYEKPQEDFEELGPPL